MSMKRCIHWTNTKTDAPLEEKMCPKRPGIRMTRKCINTDFVEDCGYFELELNCVQGGLCHDDFFNGTYGRNV